MKARQLARYSTGKSRIRRHGNWPLIGMVSSGCPTNDLALLFCRDASPEQAALLAATQRPIALACIQEKAPRPAWRAKPSWYLVGEGDRMINPVTQRFLAGRTGARVRSEKGDHTPLVTAPGVVVEMILHA